MKGSYVLKISLSLAVGRPWSVVVFCTNVQALLIMRSLIP